MKDKGRTKTRLLVLLHVLAAGWLGTSCTTDLRDALWAGTLDYVSGTATSTLSAAFTFGDLAGGGA